VIEAKEPKLRVAIIEQGQPIGGTDIHTFLGVVLKSGRMYAIDVSGAQYGYYEPVVPLDVFSERLVARVIAEGNFGTQKKKLDDYYHGNPYRAALAYNMTTVVTKIEEFLSARLHSDGCTLRSLLTMSSSAYTRKSNELFSHIDREIATFVSSKLKTSDFVTIATRLRFTSEKTGKEMLGDVFNKGDGSKDVYRTFDADDAAAADARTARSMAVDGDRAGLSAAAEVAEILAGIRLG
jgi:hypothetical protein